MYPIKVNTMNQSDKELARFITDVVHDAALVDLHIFR